MNVDYTMWFPEKRKEFYMSIITIVGAGMMGSAMSCPATVNGHEVRLVGTCLDREIIESVRKTHFHPTLHRNLDPAVKAFQIGELDAALEGCDLVICGVSSFGVEYFAEEVLPHLKSGTRVLAITKGLRSTPDGWLLPFPEYYSSLRSDLHFMAVGGPCTSFELQDKNQTLVYFCGKDPEILRETKALFATEFYHIITTTDIAGVETAVAMKNAYAMGTALAIGLSDQEAGVTDDRGIAGKSGTDALDFNPKYNPQAALFGQSCREMARLTKMMKGDPLLIASLPGAGDLYVTIFGGRTRRLGVLLGRGFTYEKAKEVLKGVTLESTVIITRVAQALRCKAEKGGVDPEKEFPFLMHLDAILNKGEQVSIPWNKFEF